ncbi:hypothetical protein L596_030221 [Steinernema carpocapsae]|uniref:Nuclear receptor domain-containing protein n=1 Tax=Steinernema carpocapsae TaxID=34508 RepID=A0A4U5LS29_STECR|nr:hypothetical protein L596_030221 [Steinernema carpocapsae]
MKRLKHERYLEQQKQMAEVDIRGTKETTPKPSTLLSSSPVHSEASCKDNDPPTICLVCGAEANCRFYGAACCNSCKTFFRRAVSSPKALKCQGNKKCNLTHDVRTGSGAKDERKCRLCRFLKCQRVGMLPEAVQIKQSRLNTPSAEPTPPPPPAKSNAFMNKLNVLIAAQKCSQILRRGNSFPKEIHASIFEAMGKPCAFGQVDQFMHLNLWPQLPFYGFRGAKPWLYTDSALAIEFYKALDCIGRLPFQDQYYLIKDTVPELVTFCGSYGAYCQNQQLRVVFPDGSLHRWNVLKIEENVKDLNLPLIIKYTENVETGLVPTFAKLKITEMQAVLLMAVIALNPEAKGLSPQAQDYIEAQRLDYLKALMKNVQDEDMTHWIHRFQQIYHVLYLNRSISHDFQKLFLCGLAFPECYGQGNLVNEVFSNVPSLLTAVVT